MPAVELICEPEEHEGGGCPLSHPENPISRKGLDPRLRYVAKMCAVGPINCEVIHGSDNIATPRIVLSVFVKVPKQLEFRGLSGCIGSEHLE